MSIDMFSLVGKTALITGGNGGIGRALALGFQAAGARVAVTGRNAEKNAATIAELGPEALVCNLDVRDEDGVRDTVNRVIEHFGSIHILVNNAGNVSLETALEMSKASWNAVLETHLTGAFLCAQQAGRAMVRQGDGGKIINIGSMYSLFGPPNVLHYATAKTGMLGLTRGLAVELAVHNIQVNAILPGWIETDLNRERLRASLGDHARRMTPARRLGLADDLVGAAIFLASPASDFVTGVALPVDGGYSVADRYWQDG
ncbi:MAG: SDR family oxidoreductase [Caldilineaceae bacterium]|nr:SDR family oxidoreductase [Caldilineaceae bacterium]